MKALAKLKAESGVWMTDVPVPCPGPEDVLVRVRKAAICGTDIHIFNRDEWAASTIPVPLVVEHESSGEIVETGRSVTRPLRIGERVSGEGHLINPHSAAARRPLPP